MPEVMREAMPVVMPETTPRSMHQSMPEATSQSVPAASVDEAWTPRFASPAEKYPEQLAAPRPLSPGTLLQAAGLQQALLPPPGLQHQAAQLLEDQRRRFQGLDKRHNQQAVVRPPVLLGSFSGSGSPASALLHGKPGPAHALGG